jgi:hypothetical protein
MKKHRKTFLVTAISLLTIWRSFAQRRFDDDPEEVYNWSDFDSGQFFYAAIISAVIIALGLLLRNKSDNSFLKGFGKVIIVIGSFVAFAMLGGPILGAIQIIWQVVVGAAIFLGIIYWVYSEFIEKKQG